MSSSARKLRREQGRIQQAAVRRITKEVGKKLSSGSVQERQEGQLQATEVVKGERGGRCNVTACTSGKPAIWWNRSTRAWYCRDCAQRINIENGDAGRLLCITAGEHNLEEKVSALAEAGGGTIPVDLPGVKGSIDVIVPEGQAKSVVVIPGSRPGQPTEYVPMERFRGKARPLEVLVDDPSALIRGLNRWAEGVVGAGGAVNEAALAAVKSRLEAGESAREVLGEWFEAVQQLAYG